MLPPYTCTVDVCSELRVELTSRKSLQSRGTKTKILFLIFGWYVKVVPGRKSRIIFFTKKFLRLGQLYMLVMLPSSEHAKFYALSIYVHHKIML